MANIIGNIKRRVKATLANSSFARQLPASVAKKLPPGTQHFTAYVGPPDQYDYMGATQFGLLCSLGLREHHKLLDFGCGSLRAGRLFLPYLNPGCYFGIEPNAWLIEEAINKVLGKSIIDIKKPSFFYHDTFTCHQIGQEFDYIIAQSIFSHTGFDLAQKILREFADTVKTDGIIAITFIHEERDTEAKGWIYPGVVGFLPDTITRMIEQAGFYGTEIPWFHPRQTWYVLSKTKSRIPDAEQQKHLSGIVLFDDEITP